jgi:predicted membrane metal-binding protein
MKLIPKNKQCPCCGTVYRYGDLKELMYRKKTTCYNCKKQLKVSRKGFLVLITELLLIYIIVNLFALLLLHNLSFVLLFIINLIPTAIAFLLLPFYIKLVKNQSKDE